MYYFKDKKSLKQQGSILLPNYKVAVANKKGREFILTLDGQRPFQVLDCKIISNILWFLVCVTLVSEVTQSFFPKLNIFRICQ